MGIAMIAILFVKHVRIMSLDAYLVKMNLLYKMDIVWVFNNACFHAQLVIKIRWLSVLAA